MIGCGDCHSPSLLPWIPPVLQEQPKCAHPFEEAWKLLITIAKKEQSKFSVPDVCIQPHHTKCVFIDLMHQINVGAVIFRILSLNFRFCGRSVCF